MSFPPEVIAARAQVFEQIGRNLLRFQKLELMLKTIVAGSRISLTAGKSPATYERRTPEIHNKTLGLVSGQFFKEVASNQPSRDGHPAFFEDPSVPEDRLHISIAFTAHFSPEEHVAWKRSIQALVIERNELVHKSLLYMELETLSGCQKALATLEEQKARVLAEIEKLKRIIEGMEELKEFLRTHLTDKALLKELFFPET